MSFPAALDFRAGRGEGLLDHLGEDPLDFSKASLAPEAEPLTDRMGTDAQDGADALEREQVLLLLAVHPLLRLPIERPALVIPGIAASLEAVDRIFEDGDREPALSKPRGPAAE